jgi:Sec7-like guanine-nucleotide exchange factor
VWTPHYYSGPKGEFNKKVLHAYIDMFSFTKMPIDLAIRYKIL